MKTEQIEHTKNAINFIFYNFKYKNYVSSDRIEQLLTKFQNRYWQIDFLIKVNEKRKLRYTCANDIVKQKPHLVLCNGLVTTIQKYAELMSDKGHFSHISSSGKLPCKRAK